MNILKISSVIAGLFTLTLGIVHFFLPILLDFKSAIPRDGTALKPFKLLFFSYPTKRSDVNGIAWIMNHCASFVLVTIGCLDLFFLNWLTESAAGKYVCFWIATWWFIRSFSQFYLGQRKGDWFVFFGFSAIGGLHFLLGIHAF